MVAPATAFYAETGVTAVVEGGALLEGAAEGLDDGPEAVLLHALAVGGAGGPGDALVHQRAAEVVDAGPQQLLHAPGAELHPRRLDVRDRCRRRRCGRPRA